MTRIYSGFKIFGLKNFFNWKWINFGPIYSCPKLKLKCLGLLLKSQKWAKSSVFMSIPWVGQVILWLSATASVHKHMQHSNFIDLCCNYQKWGNVLYISNYNTYDDWLNIIVQIYPISLMNMNYIYLVISLLLLSKYK